MHTHAPCRRPGGRSTTPRAILGVIACVCAVGCLPRERLNTACRWTADSAVLPPPGDPARRAHLIEDIRVAEELGIRHGDAILGHVNTDTGRRAREWCTEISMQEIMHRHNVSRAELASLTGVRVLWVDLLAVFLPMGAVFLVVSRRVIERVVAGYDPEDRWLALAVLIILMPVAAGLALGVTQMWGWLVEVLRVRDEHISYRAFELPASRHGWLVWGAAMALFAVVAVTVLLRKREITQPGRRAIG